jgi:hypothetical protein
MFNFGSIGDVKPTSGLRRLAPWDIYPVEFKGCKVEHIQGKKDPSMTYDILKVRFEGEDGYYEESIFFPKEQDGQRPTYTNKEGHEYEGPSSFERTKTFIAQLITVICGQEKFQKFAALSPKFKDFGQLCEALIKITDPEKGKKTNLKLVGRTKQDGTIEAALPKFVAVNKQGELFTSDNFIGENLFFTPYEEGKKKEFKKAKPTPSSDLTADAEATTDNSDMNEVDFNSLLQ